MQQNPPSSCQPASNTRLCSFNNNNEKTRATMNSSAAVFFPTTHTRDTAGHHYRRGSVHSERWARREDDTTTLVNTDFLWQFEKQNTRSPAVTPGLTSPLRSRFQHSFPSSVNVHNPLHVTSMSVATNASSSALRKGSTRGEAVVGFESSKEAPWAPRHAGVCWTDLAS